MAVRKSEEIARGRADGDLENAASCLPAPNGKQKSKMPAAMPTSGRLIGGASVAINR